MWKNALVSRTTTQNKNIQSCVQVPKNIDQYSETSKIKANCFKILTGG